MERLRVARGRVAGWLRLRNAVLFGLLILSILTPSAFVHYLLCPAEGTGDGPQAQQFFLQRKLGFVYLISAPWCTQPLIRGFRRLERGIGPGLMISTSMGNWVTNDSRVAEKQAARQKDNGRVGDSRLGWRGEKRG